MSVACNEQELAYPTDKFTFDGLPKSSHTFLETQVGQNTLNLRHTFRHIYKENN